MSDSTLYLNEVIPYKLNAVHQFELALHRHMLWLEEGRRPNIEIKFDGKTAITGNSNAYINPIVESGILHIRSLMEFAGLRCDSQGKTLNQIGKRRKQDDAGVEKLIINGQTVNMIDLNKIRIEMGDKADQIMYSISFVMWLANKFVAHFTTVINHDKDTYQKMLLASQATPLIIINHVYIAQGLRAPDYKNNIMH